MNLLIDRGPLRDAIKVEVLEQEGMCLFILAKEASHQDVKDKFKLAISVVKHYHIEVFNTLVELSSNVI